MRLLFESKRMWLLSYTICLMFAGIIYFCLWKNPIARTIGIMLIEIQAIIFVFFLFITILKWRILCRAIASLLYLGISIYEGVNGNLIKWYIIVPIFLVTEVYMIWNLGGVLNCIIASPYRDRLNNKVNAAQHSYGLYAHDLNDYNKRNGLGFFSKVRRKSEPNWRNLVFNYTALEMFDFDKAIWGIDSSELTIKEGRLDNINSRLSDKLGALDSNRSIHEEKSMLERIRGKAKCAELDVSGYDESSGKLESLRKKNVRTGKGILKKRL